MLLKVCFAVDRCGKFRSWIFRNQSLHVKFFGVMVGVPILQVHFVSLDLVHAERPFQVWSYFLIICLSIRIISSEDLLSQHPSVPVPPLYCVTKFRVFRQITLDLLGVTSVTRSWIEMRYSPCITKFSQSQLPKKKEVVQCRGMDFFKTRDGKKGRGGFLMGKRGIIFFRTLCAKSNSQYWIAICQNWIGRWCLFFDLGIHP